MVGRGVVDWASRRGFVVSSLRMPSKPVELRVGGHTYRVVSSASAAELERLAAVVDEKLHEIVAPGRPLSPQAMLLVAIALAHDVELEKRRSEELRARSRLALSELIDQVEATLSVTETSLAVASTDSAT